VRDIVSIAVTIGQHFLDERRRPFTQSPFASLIRNEWPNTFSSLFPTVKFPHIKARASAGQSQWSEAPFMAFLHDEITSTPQAGYYPVILFERGFHSFCLVLAQGSTSLEKLFGAKKTSAILKDRAPRLRDASPGWRDLGFSHGPFHTYSRGNTSPDVVADDPWAASIAFGKRYRVEAPPSLPEFTSDLNSMLELYAEAVRRIGRHFLEEERTAEQLATSGELHRAAGLDGALKVAYHKTIERKHRNSKLVRQVKKELGCICQGCGVALSSTYGTIGADFIEAHHLTPLAQTPDHGIELTAKDFAVLCPTCHRIIHRLGCPSLTELQETVNPKVRAFYEDLIQQT
jgi:5-methylcytosine-specific restriction protein A